MFGPSALGLIPITLDQDVGRAPTIENVQGSKSHFLLA
jgi:hypothetical protein